MLRTLGIIVRNFTGQNRRPVYATAPAAQSRYRHAPAGLQKRTVEVTAVVRETADAVTLRLKAEGVEPLRYRAGQFLTLVLKLNGEEVRRAYSFSSSPLAGGDPSVTVKRVAGGLVSNYLNDHAAPGLRLEVLGPSGEFVVEPRPDVARRFVFVAGGSGITPLMSLTRTLLEREPKARIDLLYGNRAEGDVIFRAELDALAAAHPNLRVVHVLERAEGRLTGDKVVALAGELAGASFYLCGPEPMMDGAAAALREAGVEAARIKTERFTAPARRTSARPAVPQPITFARSGVTVTPKAGETVLEAGLGAGLPLGYSCAMGGCAACKVKVVEGTAVMDEPNCLSELERKQGYVLACVACAATPLKVEA